MLKKRLWEILTWSTHQEWFPIDNKHVWNSVLCLLFRFQFTRRSGGVNRIFSDGPFIFERGEEDVWEVDKKISLWTEYLVAGSKKWATKMRRTGKICKKSQREKTFGASHVEVWKLFATVNRRKSDCSSSLKWRNNFARKKANLISGNSFVKPWCLCQTDSQNSSQVTLFNVVYVQTEYDLTLRRCYVQSSLWKFLVYN